MSAERIGRWLDTPHTEPRWLMIFLWVCVTASAINGVLSFVEWLT